MKSNEKKIGVDRNKKDALNRVFESSIKRTYTSWHRKMMSKEPKNNINKKLWIDKG